MESSSAAPQDYRQKSLPVVHIGNQLAEFLASSVDNGVIQRGAAGLQAVILVYVGNQLAEFLAMPVV